MLRAEQLDIVLGNMRNVLNKTDYYLNVLSLSLLARRVCFIQNELKLTSKSNEKYKQFTSIYFQMNESNMKNRMCCFNLKKNKKQNQT